VTLPQVNPFTTIMVPSAGCKVHLKAVVLSSSFQDEETWVADQKVAELVFVHQNKKLGPLSMNLSLKVGATDMAMVVLFVEYEVNGKTVEDPKWLPAAAVAFGPVRK
jgi:hypothetical protein